MRNEKDTSLRVNGVKSHAESGAAGLTKELSSAMHQLTQFYPGATKISDLRLAPRTLPWNQYEIYGYSYITYPPDSWGPFYFGLHQHNRKPVSEALKTAMRSGFSTIQQIRDATREQLLYRENVDGESLPKKLRKTKISDAMATFLKDAFGPELSDK